MGHRIELPKPVGAAIAIALFGYFAWWMWTFTGSSGELNPRSPIRILFPIWGNTAIHNTGYTWAREGDIILIEYDVRLEEGFFSLTVGKTRWLYRHLLAHEQRRSIRGTATGQMEYRVKQNGRHAIWAGRYSVWSGEARVRWRVVPRPI